MSILAIKSPFYLVGILRRKYIEKEKYISEDSLKVPQKYQENILQCTDCIR